MAETGDSQGHAASGGPSAGAQDGPRRDSSELPKITWTDGTEADVLGILGEGRDKIVYEVRHPAHPERSLAFAQLRGHDEDGGIGSGEDRGVESDRAKISNLKLELNLLLAGEVDPERVIRTCDQLIDLDRRDEAAYFNRGVMRSVQGDFAEAVADLAMATRLAPGDAMNWLHLGVVVLNTEDRDLALYAAERAAALDTTGVSSYLASFPGVRDRLVALMAERAAGTASSTPALAAACAQVGDASPLPQMWDYVPRSRGRDDVRASAIRWPRTGDELRLPEGPLLPPGTELRVSEASLSSSALSGFSAGYMLAVMHAHGFVHGDCHPGNLMFDLVSGWTLTVDASSAGEPEGFSAFHAAYDFLAPRLTFDGPSLAGMLVGYGKALSARSYSSSFVPEEVFALLGTEVDYAVRTDPEPSAVARLVQCLDMAVRNDPAPSVSVGCHAASDLEHLLLRQPRWAGALALATTILHYDAAALWRQLAGRLDRASSPVGAFAAEVARIQHQGRQAAPASDLGAELEPACALIRALAAVTGAGGVVRTPAATWPPGRVEGAYALVSWVNSHLDATDSADATRANRVMDDALELVDAIALAWDQRPGHRWLSQHAAQVAQVLLRAAASGPLLDERRELAMAARHARLSWLASRNPDTAFRADAAAPYILNRLRTLRNLFVRTIPPRTSAEPLPQPGIHWSLAWRGLALVRDSVVSHAGRPEPAGDAQFLMAVEFVGLYRDLLRQYVLALISAGFPWTERFVALGEEFKVVDSVFDGKRSLRDLTRSNWAELQRLAARIRNSPSFQRGFIFDRRLPVLMGVS